MLIAGITLCWQQPVIAEISLSGDTVFTKINEQHLSPDETSYLKNKGSIRVCIQGENREASKEFWQLFQRKIPFDYHYIETADQHKKNQCDIWPWLNKTSQQSSVLKFSRSYLTLPLVIVAKVWADRIDDLEQLPKGKIAVLANLGIKKRLTTRYGQLEFIEYNSIEACIDAVRNKEVNAWVTSSLDFQLGKEKFWAFDLEETGRIDETITLKLHMATVHQPLLAILEKMITSTTTRERSVAVTRAVNPELAAKMDEMDTDKIQLTPAQRLFLRHHGPLNICVRDFYSKKKLIKPPDEQLWQLFNQNLQADFKLINISKNNNRENVRCDIWPMATVNKKSLGINYSKVFYTSPYVIVTLAEYPSINDIHAFIENNTLAVIEPALKEKLKRAGYFTQDIELISDAFIAVKKLHDYTIEAFIIEASSFELIRIITADRHIKISGKITENLQHITAIGINKKYPELLGIANKVLEKTAAAEIIRLLNLVSDNENNPLYLNQKEKQLISETKILNVCIDESFPQQVTDLWSILSKHLPVNFNLIKTSSGEKLSACDIIPLMGKNHAVKKGLLSSNVLINDRSLLLTLNTAGSINDFEILKNKTIVVVQGLDSLIKIQDIYPDVNVEIVRNYKEAIARVKNKKAVAYISSELKFELFKTTVGFEGMNKSMTLAESFSNQYIIAVHKKNKEWLPIFNKVLKNTQAMELYKLFPVQSLLLNEKVSLSKIQNLFLKDMGPINVCVSALVQGLDRDYWEILNTRLGIEYRIKKMTSRHEMLKNIEQGVCDIHPGSAITTKRMQRIKFSTSRKSSPYLIIIKEESAYIYSEKDFSGLHFSMIKNSASLDDIREFYPEMVISEVDNIVEGLNGVHDGKVDGFISFTVMVKLSVIADVMQGLKVGGQLSKVQHKFAIAITPKKPELVDIINRVVAITPSNEMDRMVRSYTVSEKEAFDYRLMWQISAAIIAAMMVIIIWNRHLAKINDQLSDANANTQQALDKVAELLNSSGEGFLSLKEDLLIEEQHSTECLSLFDREKITGMYFPDILFEDNTEEKSIFFKGVSMLYHTEDAIKRDFIIQLLPERIIFEDKILQMVYQFNQKKLIVIIKDISMQETLKKQLDLERNSLQKIVYAVTNQSEVLKICEEFAFFLTNQAITIHQSSLGFRECMEICYRHIHTYKALFMQIHFHDLSVLLHHLESDIKAMMEDDGFSKQSKDIDGLCTAISDIDFFLSLQIEKKEITEKLGEEYFSKIRLMQVNQKDFYLLEAQVENLPSSLQKGQLQTSLKKLKSISLSDSLQFHLDAAVSYAERIGKRVKYSSVEGPDILIDPEKFNPFIHSLVHIFRNSIGHGIELPDDREFINKAPEGLIVCKIQRIDNKITIMISDDGAGIDIGLQPEVECMNIDRSGVNPIDESQEYKLDKKSLDTIFTQGFSTQSKVDMQTGRGIGLPAVKEELEKINGTMQVYSRKCIGTLFIFKLPI